jgi:hypothetical protein
MLKIFKTVIRPNEGSDLAVRDSKHRVTMDYVAETKTIKVRVDEVRSPNPNLDESLPEDTPTILRDVHTTADFVLVTEREFTELDFVMRGDSNKWIVEYDSETKQISDPIGVYELSKQYINGAASHENIYRNLNKYRYESNGKLTPLFMLDTFYKSLGFDGSTIQFFIEDLQVDLLDSILEVSADQVTEVTSKEYEYWLQYNVRPAIGFEILDSQGKIVSSVLPTVDAAAKTANFVSMEAQRPRDTTGVSEGIVGANLGADSSGNRFKVSLPAGELINVRVLTGSRIWKLVGTNPSATFDITTVNGLSYKNRITLPNYTPDQQEEPNQSTSDFIAQHPNHVISGQNSSFAGTDSVVLRSTGLSSGDYMKMKLSVGEFLSYAELWVEIV